MDDAVRALALEQHTVSEMAKLLKGNNKEDFVDLTHGGRLILLFTDQEHSEVKADYEAAKAAGIDMSGVQWLVKEEVWNVSTTLWRLFTSTQC